MIPTKVVAVYVPADETEPMRRVVVEAPDQRKSWEQVLEVSCVERMTACAKPRVLAYGDDIATWKGSAVNSRAGELCGELWIGDAVFVGYSRNRHRDVPDAFLEAISRLGPIT